MFWEAKSEVLLSSSANSVSCFAGLLTSFASLIFTFSSSVRSQPKNFLIFKKFKYLKNQGFKIYRSIYCKSNTFLHSYWETLLDPTLLARSSIFLVYNTRLTVDTEEWLEGIILHGPSKKGLAGFTTESTEVVTFCLITTHSTYLVCWLVFRDNIFFVAWAKRTVAVIHLLCLYNTTATMNTDNDQNSIGSCF